MGTVHQLLLEFGREGALKSDLDRSVVDAAAGYLTAEDNDTGYLYSGWALAALPHKRLADDALWQVKNDRVTLVVQPVCVWLRTARQSMSACPMARGHA